MFSFKALEVAFLLQVRGQEVERGGSVGLGHRRRQLRHLPVTKPIRKREIKLIPDLGWT